VRLAGGKSVNWDREKTIGVLIVTAVVVWGLGIRAAVQSNARADREPDTTAKAIAAEITPPTTTPTAIRLSVTPMDHPTSTPWSKPTLTPSPTSTPWPMATPTGKPTATPSPETTPGASDIPTPILTPYLTPTIPGVGRFLLVNQDEQQLHVYENGVEIRTIPVSTGKPVANGFTPAWRGEVGRYWGAGPFLNTNLWSDYMWYLFPGARGSILIHSVPYTRAGQIKLYDQPEALGVEPVSHGCVRISPEDAQWLKHWGPVGVPIEITTWSGEIGPPDESLWALPFLQD
jgi:lipoprotein-anchoring transpeptidase ErfK/SrfK